MDQWLGFTLSSSALGLQTVFDASTDSPCTLIVLIQTAWHVSSGPGFFTSI